MVADWIHKHEAFLVATDERAPSRRTMLVCAALAVATLAAAVPTLLVDGVLNGPAVMNGSARGTALVVLVVALPLLGVSLAAAAKGSVRGWAGAVGALAYLAYNGVLFALATPFNELFLLYVGMLGLSVWSLVSVLIDTPPPTAVSERLPARGIAVFIWVVGGLNAVAWLRAIVADLGNADDPAHLAGTGLIVNPIHVQDLAVWIPALVVAAHLLWERRPWGGFLAGAGLVFWLVEAVGVAVDQRFGSAADPASTVATMGGALLFAVLALVTVVPLGLWLRHPQAEVVPPQLATR